jgi:predicted alpha/beta hydrolase
MTFALAACASSSSSPSARSSGTSDASSPTAAAGRTISFTATDGVRLTGVLYGTGTTAVVLSNMGDNDPKLWHAFAPVLAHRGYLVLTYSYRFPRNASSFDSDIAVRQVNITR